MAGINGCYIKVDRTWFSPIKLYSVYIIDLLSCVAVLSGSNGFTFWWKGADSISQNSTIALCQLLFFSIELLFKLFTVLENYRFFVQIGGKMIVLSVVVLIQNSPFHQEFLLVNLGIYFHFQHKQLNTFPCLKSQNYFFIYQITMSPHTLFQYPCFILGGTYFFIQWLGFDGE